jgi:hypothetical protein
MAKGENQYLLQNECAIEAFGELRRIGLNILVEICSGIVRGDGQPVHEIARRLDSLALAGRAA